MAQTLRPLAVLTLAIFLPGGGASAQTIFRYSFELDSRLPVVTDVSGAGNDATAGAMALLSPDIPGDGVPADAGDASLDSGTNHLLGDSGAVLPTTRLLANDAIAAAGGFTLEAWFRWNGGGLVNSIIDYAGTEKIVIDIRDGGPGLVEMLISDGDRIPIGVAEADRWHYVAVVFDTGGREQDGDGTIEGTLIVYLDSLHPAGIFPGRRKDNYGDSLVRGIGVGQHPLGFEADFFDGLVYEPRVSLRALDASDLLLEGELLPAPSPVLAYSFSDTTSLPVIEDRSPAGNDATAGPVAALSDEIPSTTAAGAGNASLDTGGDPGAGAAGAVTNAPSLLDNGAIAAAGGFTLETWFRWNGGGEVNAIMDYAGTERITVSGEVGSLGSVQVQLFAGEPVLYAIGTAIPGTWHYVAVVFRTRGAPVGDDARLTGTLSVFLDGIEPRGTFFGATKDDFGDVLGLGIGLGQSPAGNGANHFDGLLYEPRVTLGPLPPSALSFVEQVAGPADPGVVFRYSFTDDDEQTLPIILDDGPAGTNATAGPGIAFSLEVPEIDVPDDSGFLSLDTASNQVFGPSGIVTQRPLLLSNARVAQSGGFTMEAWFLWNGGGRINAVLDYAGTEKIVVRPSGQVEMLLDDRPPTIVGSAIAGQWHYVAVVFDTGGAEQEADGSIRGALTTYFDGLDLSQTIVDVVKNNRGDSLERGIGVGQHPLGFEADFFDGLIFEPRVSLGPLAPGELLHGSNVVEGPIFRRGDVDGNGILEITDPINDLEFQFLGTFAPLCPDAHDFDDNGLTEITDPVNSLGHQFLGDPPPPAPGVATCGVDPTADDLGCESYPADTACGR